MLWELYGAAFIIWCNQQQSSQSQIHIQSRGQSEISSHASALVAAGGEDPPRELSRDLSRDLSVPRATFWRQLQLFAWRALVQRCKGNLFEADLAVYFLGGIIFGIVTSGGTVLCMSMSIICTVGL